MSDSQTLPWFPVPFWDADTIMSASVFPRDNAKMLVPEPRTILERNLDSFTAAIREKDMWWKKVNKPDVVERWRSEAAQQNIDDKTFNFALQQLRHQAKQCSDLGVRPSPVPGVFESDTLLDTELQQQLLAALKPLEDVPEGEKDWHPGSDKQVLDLVHPSLFPLVYGLSRSTTGAKPPPPRNGTIAAEVGSPSWYPIDIDGDVGDGAPPDDWNPEAGEDAGFDEMLSDEDADPGEDDFEDHFSDLNDEEEEDDEDEDPDGHPLGGPEDEFPPDWEPGQEEEDDGGGILGTRMQVGSGQPEGERAAAAAAVAAAPTWHTPAFSAWKTEMGSGAVVADPPAKSPDPANRPPFMPATTSFVSERFQWLPADVLVGADGRVVFDSYVNNLHPERHAALYAATARLIERAVPLFERTLAASAQLPQRVVEFEADCETWWKPEYCEWWEGMQESGEAATVIQGIRAQRAAAAAADGNPGGAAVEAEEYEDEEDEFGEEIEELYNQRRQFQPPRLPEEFKPPPQPPRVDLRRRRLQVIVKFAEIVATPEKPRYGGGVWHVEGMENEAIVASCIAYLSHDNLSESRLHFRTMVSDPAYAQGDNEGVRRMFGIEDEGRLNEPLGSALCAPGRMLCWPNAFQHRVAPFELADASRPGVRKFVVLFLVDPRFRVLSTRDVPPQQMAWHDAESRLGSALPGELKQKVDALREFPVSLERAKALRLELMEERKMGLRANNWETFERRFSLCEH